MTERCSFEVIKRMGFVALVALAACGGQSPPPREPALVADPPLTEGGESKAEDGLAATELDRGVAYIKNDKFAEAKQHLEVAMERKPSAEAAFYLGVVAEKTGDKKGAEAMYKKSLELNAGFSEATVNLAALYLDDPARIDDAIAVLEKAPPKIQDDPRVIQNLAYAWSLKGDVAKASKYYETALAKGEDPQLRFAYGTMLFESKEPEKAAVQLKKALDGTKDDAPLLVTIGRMLGSAKAYGDCVKAFDRAIAIKDTEAEWYVRRGTCRHELKDEPGAQADFDKATKVDPKYAAAYYYLGMSLLAQGKKVGATVAMGKALKFGGDTPIGKSARQKLREIEKMK